MIKNILKNKKKYLLIRALSRLSFINSKELDNLN